jgi:hypothetical protein
MVLHAIVPANGINIELECSKQPERKPVVGRYSATQKVVTQLFWNIAPKEVMTP